MKKDNISYPHPVLTGANDDYTDCSFELSWTSEPVISGENIELGLKYTLVSEELNRLIKEGSAKVVVHVESKTAAFRKLFDFDSSKTELAVVIKNSDVNRELKVSGFIVAKKEIYPFKPDERNKEIFGNIIFQIRTGDILAISNFYIVSLDSYDPLADRPSIFRIRKKEDANSEIEVDFMTDAKITIYLNSETYDAYQKLYAAPDTRLFLSSFLAAPVLTEVLFYIKDASLDDLEDIKTKKWYQVIYRRLQDLNINLGNESSMIPVVNKVLPHIFKTSIDSLTEICKVMLMEEGEHDES